MSPLQQWEAFRASLPGPRERELADSYLIGWLLEGANATKGTRHRMAKELDNAAAGFAETLRRTRSAS